MEMELGFDGFGDMEAMDLEDFDGEDFDTEDFGDGFELEGFDGEDFDGFDGFDGEGEGDGLDAETASMLMDMYADMAAEAESDAEADAFLPLLAALAPMAVKALAPVAVRAAKKHLPTIAKGVVSAGRKILTSGAGRSVLRALPTIAKGIARDQLKRVARGQSVSRQTVVRSAARRTVPYLRDPRRRRAAMQQCRRHAMIMRKRLGRRKPAASRFYG